MWKIIAISALVLAIAFYIYFNRDPERKIPKKGIVSPADGKIIEVTNVKKNIKIKKGLGYTSFAAEMLPATMIRIFLNITDVHVQRAPIQGTIKEIKYVSGTKLPAFLNSAWQNEHAEITIKNKKITAKVVLIAGILARRIRVLVKKGQKVQKGQRIARILLGSQACLIIPKCKVQVKRGNKVQAGTSIIT